jgi:hypothetical protein
MPTIEPKPKRRAAAHIINATPTIGYLVYVQKLSQTFVRSRYHPEIDGPSAPGLLRQRPIEGPASREDGTEVGIDSGDSSARQR